MRNKPWFDDVKKYYAFRALIKRFIVPIAVLYAIDQGLSIEQIAIIGVITGLVGFVFEVPSGAIADTLGHKKALVLSMLGQALAMGLYLGGSFEWILAASITYWAAGTLMTGTMQALFFERLRELGREHEHQKLSGRTRSFAQATIMVAMLLSGVAYTWHWWLPFIIGIGQFLLAAVIISSFTQASRPTQVSTFEPKVPLKNMLSGFKEVWSSPKLFWLTMFNAIIFGLMWGSTEFHQILLEDAGVAAGFFGLIYASKRFTGVILPPITHRLTAHMTAPIFCILTAIATSAILILTIFVTHPWSMAILIALSLAPSEALNVANNDFANKLIHGSSRATALSIQNIFQQITTLSFIAAVGWSVTSSTLPGIYASLGLLSLIVFAILSIPFIRAYARG